MIKLLKAGLFRSTDKFKSAKQTLKRYSNKYEIELYVEGEGESYVNNVSYPHLKGRILCVGPGMTRYSVNKFTCYYVHLQTDDKTAELLNKIPVSFISSHYKLCREAFDEVIRVANMEGYELLLQSRLYELLHIILSETSHKELRTDCHVNRAVQKAVVYMEENYHNNISLRDVADYVSFSPVYFHNLFKEYMGMTIHSYLNEKRIDAAKKHIVSGMLSFEEIALRCGFKSHAYFSYCFKKAEGITPNAFRKSVNLHKSADNKK